MYRSAILDSVHTGQVQSSICVFCPKSIHAMTVIGGIDDQGVLLDVQRRLNCASAVSFMLVGDVLLR